MIKQRTVKNKYLLSLFFLTLAAIAGCSDEDDLPEIPSSTSYAGPQGNKIIISDIQWPSDRVNFDYIAVEVVGKDWQVLTTVKGYYEGESIILELPESISTESLQLCQYDETKYGQYYWPQGAVSTDPLTGVAALRDITAYTEEKPVGRIYLSDWTGEGGSGNKAFVYYHYAESEYSLSGSNKSFSYSATFETGWNAYANINNSKNDMTHCTTTVPESEELQWRFEVW